MKITVRQLKQMVREATEVANKKTSRPENSKSLMERIRTMVREEFQSVYGRQQGDGGADQRKDKEEEEAKSDLGAMSDDDIDSALSRLQELRKSRLASKSRK